MTATRKTAFRVMAAFFLVSLFTFLSWDHKNPDAVAGDEPHYLIVADAINHGTFEQSAAYRDEFRNRRIVKHGLAPRDAEPGLENTHTRSGPNGMYNMHNVGLPMLLAPPFRFAGVFGAKLAMLLLSCSVILAAWHLSGAFGPASAGRRALVVLATCLAMPLVPAATQIYPDILAGGIVLGALYWYMTCATRRPLAREALWGAALVLLPWLQIKLGLACAMLVLALLFKIHAASRDWRRIVTLGALALVSCLLLAWFNHHAYANISGPYLSGALEVSRTAFMVLLGLHIDQNHGFLMQNPIFFVGLFSIGALFRHDWRLATLWLLIFLSMIVPNGLHPAWYGGYGFSGRFMWSAAVVFMLPTLFGLLRLGQWSRRALGWTLWLSALLQAYLFYGYAISHVNLYNKSPEVWLGSYSTFYQALHDWLPALYNAAWAYGYTPNLAWLLLVCLLVLAGCLPARLLTGQTTARYAVGALLLLLVVARIDPSPPQPPRLFAASELPSLSGRLHDGARIAEQGVDQAGVLSFGPYTPLARGRYRVRLRYSSMAPPGRQIGTRDIYDASKGQLLAVMPLYGTAGLPQTVEATFRVRRWQLHTFEFRNSWNGVADLRIESIELMHI